MRRGGRVRGMCPCEIDLQTKNNMIQESKKRDGDDADRQSGGRGGDRS
jgi:hypothetical protein